MENENTKAAFQWLKEIANSKLVKDAAAGAAVGAVLAVPVPLIGPAIGAMVGAVLGVYKNITRHEYAPDRHAVAEEKKKIKWIEKYENLIKIDELRRNGILTEDEFQTQKNNILSNK